MHRRSLHFKSKGSAFDFTTNLVAAYQFENNFNDYTGNHNATVSGTVGFVSGQVNQCADFQGSTDYLTVSDHNDFSFGNGVTDIPFTMSFWVKLRTHDTVNGTWFINKRGLTTNREWQIFYTAAREIRMSLFDQSTGGQINITYAIPAFLNNWTHIVLTYNGSGVHTGIKLYFNAVSVGYTAIIGSYTAMENLSSDVIIGARAWDTSTSEVDGFLDEIYPYKNKILTQAEITYLYSQQLLGNTVLP